jgi:hypothetical protein
MANSSARPNTPPRTRAINRIDLLLSHHMPDDRLGVITLFWPGARPVRLCARCSGQYLGMVAAVLGAPPQQGREVWTASLLLAGTLISAAEWGIKTVLGTPSQPFTRFIAGLGFGFCASSLALHAFLIHSTARVVAVGAVLGFGLIGLLLLHRCGRIDVLMKELEAQARLLSAHKP